MSDVNIDATRAEAGRRSDVFQPIYPADTDDPRNAIIVPDEYHDAFDRACLRGRDLFPLKHPGEAAMAVATALAALLPRLGIVYQGDEKHAEFHWARARCLFAGFGWHAHAVIAAKCCDLFPICDLDPDEDQETWQKKLADAHRMCGWPASLALLRWRDIYMIGERGEHPSVEDWQRCCAVLHILKHVRTSALYQLVTTYLGAAIRLDLDPTSNALGTTRSQRERLAKLLGVLHQTAKHKHAMSVAFDHALSTMTTANILRRQPLACLPGVVLAGPWSLLVPDPTQNDGFIQHGLRLTGVWIAGDGKVVPTTGDTDDVVSYDWPTDPTDSAHELKRFTASIPKQYDRDAYPYEVLIHAFPNVRTTPYASDPRVFATLFDAVMCSSLLGPEIPALDLEKPMVICAPEKPTLDESTNQGKSKCAHMLARACAPGIPTIGVSDTDDAAGRRSLAACMAQFGTLCAQEWRQPRHKSHLLTHENLQILLTGGSVLYGKAYANEVAQVRLRFPLFADAKALDVPPDIVNRALIIWMDTLTAAQRARGDILADIESGRMSLRLRFAALSTCVKHNLAERAANAEHSTTTVGWRFPVLRAIARILWQDRYGFDGAEQLDAGIAAMQQSHRVHTAKADENGVLAVLESGTMLSLRLHALFDGLTIQQIAATHAIAVARDSDQNNRHGHSMHTLLTARAEATGFAGKPLYAMAEALIGARARVSDRVLALALARDIRMVLPNEGDTWALPDHLGLAGWRLRRRKDVNGSVRVELLPPDIKPKPGVLP